MVGHNGTVTHNAFSLNSPDSIFLKLRSSNLVETPQSYFRTTIDGGPVVTKQHFQAV